MTLTATLRKGSRDNSALRRFARRRCFAECPSRRRCAMTLGTTPRNDALPSRSTQTPRAFLRASCSAQSFFLRESLYASGARAVETHFASCSRACKVRFYSRSCGGALRALRSRLSLRFLRRSRGSALRAARLRLQVATFESEPRERARRAALAFENLCLLRRSCGSALRAPRSRAAEIAKSPLHKTHSACSQLSRPPTRSKEMRRAPQRAPSARPPRRKQLFTRGAGAI